MSLYSLELTWESKRLSTFAEENIVKPSLPFPCLSYPVTSPHPQVTSSTSSGRPTTTWPPCLPRTTWPASLPRRSPWRDPWPGPPPWRSRWSTSSVAWGPTVLTGTRSSPLRSPTVVRTSPGRGGTLEPLWTFCTRSTNVALFSRVCLRQYYVWEEQILTPYFLNYDIIKRHFLIWKITIVFWNTNKLDHQ